MENSLSTLLGVRSALPKPHFVGLSRVCCCCRTPYGITVLIFLNLLQYWLFNDAFGIVVLDDGNQTKDNSFIYVSNE